MKVVDEKGKLFGKINIVDLVVLVLIFGVIALGIWKFTNVGAEIAPERMNITYTVKSEGVDPIIYDEALKHIPSTLMASGAKLSGEITGVEKLPHMVCVIGEDGNPIWVADPYHIDLLFTVQATVSESGDVMLTSVGTQEVRIGKKHIVKSEYIEVEGITISVERPAK